MNKKIEETTEEYERKEGSGLERAGAAAIFFLSPVLSYIMFELVTGNLAAVLPKSGAEHGVDVCCCTFWYSESPEAAGSPSLYLP